MKTLLKHILLVFFLFLSAMATADQFCYVYIQGDKETPFYVKLEGKMMPRYGKNYCILSELSAGAIHIEVLFQQNIYPPQKFTLNVPAGGYRGLLLNKQGNSFVLYDLQQKKYLGPHGDE